VSWDEAGASSQGGGSAASASTWGRYKVNTLPWPGVLVTSIFAPRLLGEAEDLRQAQAGAFTHRLGGEERLENAFDGVFGNAGAGIGERNGDIRLTRPGVTANMGQRLCPEDFQGQGALAIHCVPCIEGDVDQCGFKLAGIDPRKTRLRRHLDTYMNARACDALQHLADVLYTLAHVEDFRVQRLAAGKGEQLAGQLAGPFHGIRHRAHIALATLFRQVWLTQEVHR